jgi:hypothetical protein
MMFCHQKCGLHTNNKHAAGMGLASDYVVPGQGESCSKAAGASTIAKTTKQDNQREKQAE